MTSNMTMTAISICNFLKLIVKSTVEHYTEDFKLDIKIFKRYAKEAQETGKPVSMLWFCRSCGTYRCPEEDAYKKDTPMFITFKYYDEQEEEEARTIKAFLVTVTGMEGQKPVGYITPINYADECDRIRRYAVPAEKVELVYDKGSLVQNNTKKNGSVNVKFKTPSKSGKKSVSLKKLKIIKTISPMRSAWDKVS